MRLIKGIVMRKLLILIVIFMLSYTPVAFGAANFNILNNTSDGANIISSTLTGILGAGVVDTHIFVDFTACSDMCSFAVNSQMSNSSISNYQASTGVCTTPVNHAPYTLGSYPCQGYSLGQDLGNYASNIQAGVLVNWGYTNPTGITTGTPPPITYSTVSNAYNSSDTGWGIEFGQ